MISKITAKNFLSWEHLKFDVTQGVTLISGFNHDDNTAEGSGKSAIFNALCWGLFGFTSKDTAVDDVIKTGTKSCEVFITLEDGTVIERTRKPNDLAIWYPAAAEPIRGKDAKDTQKLIERLIGFSYETFLQSCYFAQNGQIKFILANEENKGKILSDLADLGQFDVARKKAQDEGRSLAVKLTMNEARLGDVARSIELLKTQIESMHNIKIKLAAERDSTLKDLEKQLYDVTLQIQLLDGGTPELSTEYYMKKSEIRGQLEKHKKQAAEIKAQLNMQAERQMRKNTVEKEIKDLKNEASSFSIHNADGECPTCGTHVRNIDEVKRKTILQEYKVKIEDKIKEYSTIGIESTEDLERQFEFYNKTIYQIETDLRDIDLIETTQKAQKEKLVFLLDQQTKIQQRYEKERNKSVADIDGRIALLETAIRDQTDVFVKTNDEIADMTTLVQRYDMLKDGFREVKMWAFQDILSDLNIRANGYLQQLFDQPIELKFDNNDGGEISKIKTIVTIAGVERPLPLFSGGQTRRIMLAVDLALSDIAQSRSSKPMNLLILDEYFKDLSEESLVKIYKLLECRKGSTLLVEHNSALKSLAHNTFEIEYKNGTSNAKNSY